MWFRFGLAVSASLLEANDNSELTTDIARLTISKYCHVTKVQLSPSRDRDVSDDLAAQS
jgi:hypothetical protein